MQSSKLRPRRPFLLWTVSLFACLLLLLYASSGQRGIKENFGKLHQSIQSLSSPLWCSAGGPQARLEGPFEYDNPELLGLIRDQHLTPPSAEPYCLGDDDENYLKYKDEDVFILAMSVVRHYFRDVRNGVFVEAGALDGEYLSNTLDLEKEQGWTGLLVEPDYVMHQKTLRKHRKAWVAKACLATKPFPHKAILAVVPDQPRRDQSWFMLHRGGASLMESRSSQMRLRRGFPVYESVQCLPLASILLALNITKVDYISLDVEDVEDHIIDHFPFDRIEVDVWYIEHVNFIRHDNSSSGPDEEFVRKFTSRGYSFHAAGDYVFVRDASVYSKYPAPSSPTVLRSFYKLMVLDKEHNISYPLSN